MTSDPTPAELLDLALHVARDAAELIRTRRAEGVSVAATKTSLTDVVTEVDRASEDLIRAALFGARPDDGFLGEEGGGTPGSSGVRWIVDPIDGTVNFLYGLPPYAVSIAAELHGEVVAGVVLNIPYNVAFTATRGGGSHKDGRRLRVREPAPVSERLVITGFSYRRELRVAQAEAIARLQGMVRDVRRTGCAALDMCMVAEGTADAYVEQGLHPWDYSAAALVVAEAGGRAELSPGIGDGEAMVCAPEHGFAEFHQAVRSAGLVR